MVILGLMMGQWTIIALAGGILSLVAGTFVAMYQPKNTDALFNLGLATLIFGFAGALAGVMSLTEVML